MKVDILTLFPGMFENFLQESMVGIAIKQEALQVELTNIRDFATDKHHTTDDYPYGGGAGMVMKPEPLYYAIKSVHNDDVPIIYFTPQGKLLTQEIVQKYSKLDKFIIVCGHYKEIDQRIRETLVTEELSIGDYVLSGGELPAMVMVDAIARLQPGVLGDIESALSDSHQNTLLGCPHYTRPANFMDMIVPEVLTSGNHKKIADWRQRKSEETTRNKRPDLWKKYQKGDNE